MKEIEYRKQRDHVNQCDPRQLTTLQSYFDKDSSLPLRPNTLEKKSNHTHTDTDTARTRNINRYLYVCVYTYIFFGYPGLS